jgi:hypothetical protein
VPNTGATIYIKNMLMALKAQIDATTVIVEDLNTPLLPIDRSSRQKISIGISELLHALDQIDISDMTEYFTKKLGNTHFFLQLMEFSRNRSYYRTQSKFQQIQENRNNPLHHIRSKWNKTRPQQKKLHKVLKHMEAKQHTDKKKNSG